MDALSLTSAFLLGFLAYRIGLPPLVGFLIAGFTLNALGAERGDALAYVSDLGVALLLFTIGIKLRVRSLLRPEVWGIASLHMLLTTAALAAALVALAAGGVWIFAGVSLEAAWLIGFALSFSSTVFAVKMLEERGEIGSIHGRVAIGILILQDLVAVVFLVASTGALPSVWALLLLALPLLRPLLNRVLCWVGHGELMILYGFLLVLGSGELFRMVGLRGDLGALVAGILLADCPEAEDLAAVLLRFKDLLLVGFFLEIGLLATPTLQSLGVALLLAAAIPLKVALFFVLLTRFHLRARTSLLAAFGLASYSEFGLIVGSVGVDRGWMHPEWLVLIAVAVAITFALASPPNRSGHAIYDRWSRWLRGFETPKTHPYDQPIDPAGATVLIFGMGRVGTAAYDALRELSGHAVAGVDRDPLAVRAHQAAGRNVVLGDPTDYDFWQKVEPRPYRAVLLALPDRESNVAAAAEIRGRGIGCAIAAAARYDAEIPSLREAGIDAASNLFSDAGRGLAADILGRIGSQSEGEAVDRPSRESP